MPRIFPPITVRKQERFLVPLDVRVRCAVPDEGVREHIKKAVEVQDITGYETVGINKAHGDTMAIVCSGPSLFESEIVLQEMQSAPSFKVMAVKSSHDWLIERGIIPWGTILLDGRDHVREMFTPHPGVLYFTASMCAPSTFDHLKEHDSKVVVWHAAIGANEKEAIGKKAVIIGGGSTSPLRALPLGYTIGFRNFWMFGLDSCFTDKKIHYYLDTKKQDGTERAINVTCAGRDFKTTPEMIGQAQDFEQLICHPTAPKFNITMVGDGLNKHRIDNSIYFPKDQLERGNIPGYSNYQSELQKQSKEKGSISEEEIEEKKRRDWNPNPLRPTVPKENAAA